MKGITIVSAIFAFSAAATSTAQGEPVGELNPLAESVRTVREVGAAMYSWYERKGIPEAEYGDDMVIDLQQIPTIVASELEALLVPDFLPELPREDSWGNELEFRLAPEKKGVFLMAVRSPGSDPSSRATCTRRQAPSQCHKRPRIWSGSTDTSSAIRAEPKTEEHTHGF